MRAHNIIDLTGQRFERWLVIRRAKNNKHGHIMWLCHCDCGNEGIISSSSLRNGNSKSCGCYKNMVAKRPKPEKVIDMVGQKFARLTVIERAANKDYSGAQWLCRCVCGNMVVVGRDNLKSGRTKSCGCYKKEIMRKGLAPGEAACNRTLLTYKYWAKKKDRDFTLTKQEFRNLTKGNCHYCGLQPQQISTSTDDTGNYIYNGIDRLDSSKGYTIENCVPCCKHCNRAKWDRTEEEFLTWIERAYDYRIKQRRLDLRVI